MQGRDPWGNLMLCRKVKRQGRFQSRMMRITAPGQPKPSRIVSIMTRDGYILDPDLYSLIPYRGQTWGSSNVVYFAEPVDTWGLTVLFEADRW